LDGERTQVISFEDRNQKISTKGTIQTKGRGMYLTEQQLINQMRSHAKILCFMGKGKYYDHTIEMLGNN